MAVVVILGTPHREGMTARLEEATKGASEVGEEVKVIRLAEHTVRPCLDCILAPCREEMNCNIEETASPLRKALAQADALIFGAPVYFLSVCGLAKDFMGRMRYAKEQDGKPALPIAVAGGTGRGAVLALEEALQTLAEAQREGMSLFNRLFGEGWFFFFLPGVRGNAKENQGASGSGPIL